MEKDGWCLVEGKKKNSIKNSNRMDRLRFDIQKTSMVPMPRLPPSVINGTHLGLMPHPEAHLFAIHQPQQVQQPFAEGAGLKLFSKHHSHLNRNSEVSS